jgi:osmotically-inducible protein OsmY
MRLRSQRLTVLTCGLCLATTMAVGAQAPAPDNTKTNARDRQAAQKTADDQGNSKADLDITQKIRKAIVDDKHLSTYAHNIKIVTVDGKVTLKGPVSSAAEKTAVESKAAEVAGRANVTSQVSVSDGAGAKNKKHPTKGEQ